MIFVSVQVPFSERKKERKREREREREREIKFVLASHIQDM